MIKNCRTPLRNEATLSSVTNCCQLYYYYLYSRCLVLDKSRSRHNVNSLTVRSICSRHNGFFNDNSLANDNSHTFYNASSRNIIWNFLPLFFDRSETGLMPIKRILLNGIVLVGEEVNKTDFSQERHF